MFLCLNTWHMVQRMHEREIPSEPWSSGDGRALKGPGCPCAQGRCHASWRCACPYSGAAGPRPRHFVGTVGAPRGMVGGMVSVCSGSATFFQVE